MLEMFLQIKKKLQTPQSGDIIQVDVRTYSFSSLLAFEFSGAVSFRINLSLLSCFGEFPPPSLRSRYLRWFLAHVFCLDDVEFCVNP